MKPRFQPDLEQQEHDADLGEELRLGVHFVHAQNGRPGDHAAEDLADNGRLPKAPEDLVPKLGGQKDGKELEKDLGQVVHRPSTYEETACAVSSSGTPISASTVPAGRMCGRGGILVDEGLAGMIG